jgi:GT2 family glycosyltransferase
VKTEILKQFPFDTSFPYAAMEDVELACRIEHLHGLKMKFAPEAVAYHFHPTTFNQACTRMIRVGESTAHFNAKWPGKITRNRSSETRAIKRMLISVPGILPAFRYLANVSLRIACPNRLMKFVLSWHFARGYWQCANESADGIALHPNRARSSRESN